AGEQFQSAADEIAVIDPRLFAQLARQRREHAPTLKAELIERRLRVFGMDGRENAGAGPRRLLAEIAFVHDRDADAGFCEIPGLVLTDAAAAENQYVRMLSHAD